MTGLQDRRSYRDRLLDAYRAAGFPNPDIDLSAAERVALRGQAGIGSGGFSQGSIAIPGLAIAAAIPQVGAEYHYKGTVGEELDEETGAKAAGLAALSAITELKSVIGDLQRVERLVFMQVFVVSAKGFIRQAAVANGASRAMLDVFGEQGRHGRATLGIAGLSGGMSVEVVAFFKLAD